MRHRGAVLLAALWIIAMASMIVAGLLFQMRTGSAAAEGSNRNLKAREAAMSGIHVAAAALEHLGTTPDTWRDNPEIYKHQPVSDGWFFSVYTIDAAGVRFGLDDEAGRINLNTASDSLLRGLPNMTTGLIDRLIDYRDINHLPRPLGAEDPWYDRHRMPHDVKNAPLDTVDELLAVRGFHGALLFGKDGLRPLLTVWSRDRNVTHDGQPRININTTALPDLTRQLADSGFSDQLINYIAAARINQQRFSHVSDLLEAKRIVVTPFEHDKTTYPSGHQLVADVGATELPHVMDQLTADNDDVEVGLINVNTASIDVLTAIPGIDRWLAEQVVDHRRRLPGALSATTAWLYTEGLVNARRFQTIAPYLTTRSEQFRVNSIGYSLPSGRFCIFEAVLDVSSGVTRILYLRDVTRLGIPFALNSEEEAAS